MEPLTSAPSRQRERFLEFPDVVLLYGHNFLIHLEEQVMPVTGESIRLSRLFSEGKNAVVVAVDHGLYFGPLPGMIDLPSVIHKVAGADAVLMAPGRPAHCQQIFSKRGAPACIVRLNWGSNYAAMWHYKHSHSVPMVSVADAVAQGADLVIGSLSLKNPDEAEDAQNVKVFSDCVTQKRALGIPLIGEVYPTGGDDHQPEDLHVRDQGDPGPAQGMRQRIPQYHQDRLDLRR